MPWTLKSNWKTHLGRPTWGNARKVLIYILPFETVPKLDTKLEHFTKVKIMTCLK